MFLAGGIVIEAFARLLAEIALRNHRLEQLGLVDDKIRVTTGRPGVHDELVRVQTDVVYKKAQGNGIRNKVRG